MFDCERKISRPIPVLLLKQLTWLIDHLGDTLGVHDWHEELLKDSGGDILYIDVSLIALLLKLSPLIACL